jgi:hypothetical protein
MKKTIKALYIFVIIVSYAHTTTAQECVKLGPYQEITSPSNSVSEPYTYVCQVRTNRKKWWTLFLASKTDNATFSFISPNALIGAGHAIMQVSSVIRSIDVWVYKHDENGTTKFVDSLHFRKADLKLIRPFKGRGIKNDCSIIVLNKNISAKYFDLEAWSNVKGMADKLYLCGYGYIKDDAEFNGERLWQREKVINEIVEMDGYILYPCVKTAHGDSGGPIWCNIGNKCYIIGTHVGGNETDDSKIWGEVFDANKIDILRKIVSANIIK